MKYVMIVIAALTLVACKDERPAVESDGARNYRVECVGGVEYWVQFNNIQSAGYMAVRVDPETMSFVRC